MVPLENRLRLIVIVVVVLAVAPAPSGEGESRLWAAVDLTVGLCARYLHLRV
ncbi:MULTISPECIES: hypothetical protein [Actinomycetes]|uniref:hypothetical protein n=1 Tax=Actinomycetes TaxID=1760 RepID=UPI0031F9CD07